MLNVLVNSQTLKDIANSIRSKSGKTDLMLPGEMAEEIANLSSGGIANGVEYLEFDTSNNLVSAKVYGDRVIKSQFEQQQNLASIELPSSLTSIGDRVFSSCSNLTNIELPSGITSIGKNAFYYCSKLALTSLPSGITSIGDYAFSGCSKLALTSLPSGITSIGKNAFDGCSKLALTSLPSGITRINDVTFNNCSNLKNIELPSGVTSIGKNAFSRCENLTNIELPSSLTSIDDYAFCYCSNLKNIELPSGITSIGNSLFYECLKLATLIIRSDTLCTLSNKNAFTNTPIANGTGFIYVPDDLVDTYKSATNWSTYANQIRAIEDYSIDGTVDGEIVIPTITRSLLNKSITEIDSSLPTSLGSYAFYGCENLTSVNLPSVNLPSDENSGWSVFDGCTNLTSVNLPSTTTIGERAFSNCTSLETIDLPLVTTITGNNAFYKCTSLTTVILRSTTVVNVSSSVGNAFSNTPIASGTGYVYVPDELVDAYKADSKWSAIADQIKGLSELEVE